MNRRFLLYFFLTVLVLGVVFVGGAAWIMSDISSNRVELVSR